MFTKNELPNSLADTYGAAGQANDYKENSSKSLKVYKYILKKVKLQFCTELSIV